MSLRVENAYHEEESENLQPQSTRPGSHRIAANEHPYDRSLDRYFRTCLHDAACDGDALAKAQSVADRDAQSVADGDAQIVADSDAQIEDVPEAEEIEDVKCRRAVASRSVGAPESDPAEGCGIGQARAPSAGEGRFDCDVARVETCPGEQRIVVCDLDRAAGEARFR